ncbi:MAG: NAD(P)H-binding protein [Hyphomicrobiaceae bacterium]|nr:NAD(P)H-binding protein [Hyphomicrobiaceae bacterium]
MPDQAPSPGKRLLIVGGHHGTGAICAQLARARGYEVAIFRGDIVDFDTVKPQLRDKDAVISLLGPRKGSQSDLCSRGAQNLVSAMAAHKVRRLVQVTGAMIGHRRDRLGLVYRFIVAMVPASSLADRRLQEQIVMQSGLDWTLIRPTRLSDDPARGRWRDSGEEVIGAFAHIARADVAEALLRALGDPKTIGRALTLQY